jgi:hypothetical protein
MINHKNKQRWKSHKKKNGKKQWGLRVIIDPLIPLVGLNFITLMKKFPQRK